jgi:hypothetical protein
VPGCATLNEQKRENWLRELADDSVPLLKLSRNVPHGFKGQKLLEMLVSRKIECSQATWYIRVIGLNEIVSLSIVWILTLIPVDFFFDNVT